MSDFIQVANRFMEWSLSIFKTSTARSCLIHLDREIEELKHEIDAADYSANVPVDRALEEYTDCIGVLLASACRFGITPEMIVRQLSEKTDINIARKWKDNGDGTYSHIK